MKYKILLLMTLNGFFLWGCTTSTAEPTMASTGTTSPTSAPTQTIQRTATLPPNTVSGYIVDEDGPIAGAVVRQQTTENRTISEGDGAFILSDLPSDVPVTITAWAEGYFVGWVEDALAQPQPIIITISKYYTYDNADYDWFSMEGAEGSLSCSHCMPSYEEWQEDAHAQSAINPRFLSMYNGTDLNGNQSPLTRYAYSRDYGTFPLPPDPRQPYYGAGYKLDFPDTAGNCATCHIPVAAAYPGKAYAGDPNNLQGIEPEGVFCEFCHKIGEVVLNPDTGLPYPNMPGVLSMRLYRPDGEDQLFFGNFDDVTRRVSYLPLVEESAYCAACHYGVFWDEVIYNSYGEWLESPYSDPETGQTCQDCHMPAVDYDYFVYPEKGGLIRDHSLIFSHKMPGASDEAFLQDAATMNVQTQLIDGELQVTVEIVNDNTGHHIPTDSPLRNMILLLQASDEQGQDLVLLEGPLIPDWGGIGDPAAGYYADLPGKGFALILQEMWTEISPTGSYWNPVRVLEDTRLAAFEKDTSTYRFDSPEAGMITLDVRLIFRRAFKEIMDQKAWDTPDIVMDHQLYTISIGD
jgi:hypothetical protein